MPSTHSARGFSLIETMMASALLLVVMSSVFQLLHPAGGAFRAEPARADAHQRLRAALAAVVESLGSAGAGPGTGPAAGTLPLRTAAVFPARLGRRLADPPGQVRADVVTVLRVEPGAAQTTLAQPLPSQSGDAVINLDPGCPQGDASCGFREDDTVLVAGDAGRSDLFSVAAVSGTTLTLVHDTPDSGHTHPAGTAIVKARSRTLYLRADAARDQFQLMRYDGGGGNDVPVVDHVVGLAFRYVGAGGPPLPFSMPVGAPLSASYGPSPPDLAVASTAYPAGENCVIARGVGSSPQPRLADLGSALVELPLSLFADGPWCADGTDPARFDADLLRVRAVAVTVRVEVESASLRGPAGLLFSRGGFARVGTLMVPDLEATIQVTPPNLQPGRP